MSEANDEATHQETGSGGRAKPRVLSGVQPTGQLHLGNYLGALSLWAERLDEFENFFCVVDLHALTVPEAVTAEELREKSRQVAALYIASGIDPERATIFIQSHVTAHAELMWILNCVAPLGWLYRMTQFKTKSQGRSEDGGSSERDSVGSGLLTYPVLQAADILLYEADFVPVGEDQKQHVELTRDIAQRFNHLFGPGPDADPGDQPLHLPQPLIRESGARIMGLDEPTMKMSKSRGQQVKGHAIGLLDPVKDVKKAIMRAVTDTGREFRFDHASPGVVNLLTIYQLLSGESRPAIEARFEGGGYGDLKKAVAEAVVGALEPIQERYAALTGEEGYLDDVLATGARRAREVAEPVLERCQRACGLR